MKMRSKSLAVAVMALSLGACTAIQLVSKYDEETDQQATAIQREMAEFFVKIGSSADPKDRSFNANLDFYRKVAVDFSVLEVRANAIYKNSITLQQIDLTQTNLAYLILLNKGCVTGALSDDQKAKVAQMGPDLSTGCHVASGASVEAEDRGDTQLSPFIAHVVQRQFDQQLGAILALELAKKRGEK